MEAASLIAALRPLLLPPPPGALGPFVLSDEPALRQFAAEAGLSPVAVFDVACPFVYSDQITAVRGLNSSGVGPIPTVILVANSGFVICSRTDISAKPALAGAFGLADARRDGYDGRAAEFATSINIRVTGRKVAVTRSEPPWRGVV
jgi:hypothetical protein